ncbi:hypothetical protein M8C21_004290 [Ambrosia artemisiifolia]|uniref:ALOG domain-containing protein n=1 Tax=Ambrosia artemisiifolia TaxID=4212 RepID=A0AAD5C7V9_AMBAR|nr:hypothetical protein M8C21_004290 [Ambrosia artemisiifolia]
MSSDHQSNVRSRSEIGEGSSRSGVLIPPSDHPQQQQPPQPPQLSRYESQKRRDWNTFGQYLKNQRPPVALSHCNYSHVLDFLRYLDQFGKTKVHIQGCVFFGHPDPAGPCTCPLRQAWGSLDALIGRLRAAYEENGGLPEMNPFANGAIRYAIRRRKQEGSLTRRKRRREIKRQMKKHRVFECNNHDLRWRWTHDLNLSKYVTDFHYWVDTNCSKLIDENA